MGHADRICISDCGLPFPVETERIDLAFCFWKPGFIQTLKIVAEDMKIEKIILAEEIKKNPRDLRQIQEILPDMETEFVPHSELKTMAKDCRSVIRTGEVSPYANIILQSVCIFG